MFDETSQILMCALRVYVRIKSASHFLHNLALAVNEAHLNRSLLLFSDIKISHKPQNCLSSGALCIYYSGCWLSQPRLTLERQEE